eukprot:m.175574 g.175574  ORF g.175574 m.175574 type:complete len:200 (-) comp13518_c3_seq3:424-1023(-)
MDVVVEDDEREDMEMEMMEDVEDMQKQFDEEDEVRHLQQMRDEEDLEEFEDLVELQPADDDEEVVKKPKRSSKTKPTRTRGVKLQKDKKPARKATGAYNTRSRARNVNMYVDDTAEMEEGDVVLRIEGDDGTTTEFHIDENESNNTSLKKTKGSKTRPTTATRRKTRKENADLANTMFGVVGALSSVAFVYASTIGGNL